MAFLNGFVLFEFFENIKFLASEVTFHHLGIGFTCPCPDSGSPLLSHEFPTHFVDARAHVFDGGEFYLEFGLRRVCVFFENLENEVYSVPDFCVFEFVFEVVYLVWFEDVVHNN